MNGKYCTIVIRCYCFINSVGEYEIYMLESAAFIFYGMERFLAYLPPSKIASLNFEDCQMVMLFDKAQTSNSFARQSKQDVLKT